MKTNRLSLVAFLLVFMALSGCNREKAVEPVRVNINELEGTWRLVQPASKYNAPLVLEQLLPPQILPSLPTQGFKASGKLAINTYSMLLSVWTDGSYRISVGEITSTFVGGPAEAMQFEKTYLANLKAITRFELTNHNRLWLYYNGTPSGKLVYEKM